ncbi:MAG: redox-regulated ATPase YchF [Acidobacteria bacterium]|nr:redox-regulated ATPase YchF [Acidobacteriota bacterium]
MTASWRAFFETAPAVGRTRLEGRDHLKAGIIGYAQSGKTTLFNILTQAGARTGYAGKDEFNVGIARVPDPRLSKLSEMFRPQKTTPATIEYVDLPGVAKGEFKTASQLNSLKTADALVHVVRAFEDAGNPHPEGSIDPARDVANFELEMIFADLAAVENRLERLEKELKKSKTADLESENKLLQQLRSHLENEKPLRELEMGPEQMKRMRGFAFLSMKPEIIVLNLSESDIRSIDSAVEKFNLASWTARPRLGFSTVCGKIEAEICELPPADSPAFLEALGFAEPGLNRVIRDTYRILNLISFFTVGEDEVRAWTIQRGTPAQRAAGEIHSDIERGFIRAEVVSCAHLIAAGSMAACKEKGQMRLEGKEYVVQDGDVINFRFNI